MGNLQVRFLEGWAPAMAPGYSTLRITSGLPVILEELKKSLLPGSFQPIADLSVSSRRKLHWAQPLVPQLVFFEKRVTQSFAFR